MEFDLAKRLSLEPLIQNVPLEQRRLGLFIFLAGLAHFLAFVFIEVIYPQPFFIPSPKFHVTYDYENGKNSSSESDRFWNQWFDPAGLILTQASFLAPAISPEVISLTSSQPPSVVPLPLADSNPSKTYFPTNAPTPVEEIADFLSPPVPPFYYQAPEATPSQASTLFSLSPNLKDLLLSPLPQLPDPAAASLTEAGSTVLSIGVAPSGEVKYLLIKQSCGKSSVDLLGVEATRNLRFKKSDETDLIWGEMTIFWHFQPEKKSDLPLKNRA